MALVAYKEISLTWQTYVCLREDIFKIIFILEISINNTGNISIHVSIAQMASFNILLSYWNYSYKVFLNNVDSIHSRSGHKVACVRV